MVIMKDNPLENVIQIKERTIMGNRETMMSQSIKGK